LSRKREALEHPPIAITSFLSDHRRATSTLIEEAATMNHNDDPNQSAPQDEPGGDWAQPETENTPAHSPPPTGNDGGGSNPLEDLQAKFQEMLDADDKTPLYIGGAVLLFVVLGGSCCVCSCMSQLVLR
jgi:hypothetical protein